jgi:CO/xanthine dehydrogenase FAD-binding subunit
VISEYLAPKSVSEALQFLGKWKGRAKLVAGGTNVIPDVRVKAVEAQVLIDLSRVRNLAYVKDEKQKIRIGALTTMSELVDSKVIQKYAPLLHDAVSQIGNPLVRNRATLAGNLADASPAADSAVPLLALDAKVVVEKHKTKPREVPIDRFFVGPNKTVLKRDELVREVVVFKPGPSARMAYSKFGLRNAMAVSVVSIGVCLAIEKGKCTKARIGLGAVAPTPIRVYEVEEVLAGQLITEELIQRCCQVVQAEIHPITDVRASLEYRRSMTSVLLGRLLRQASLRERA